MPVKRLFDAVERRADIRRRVVSPNTGRTEDGIQLRGEDRLAWTQLLDLKTTPPVIPLSRKQAGTLPIR